MRLKRKPDLLSPTIEQALANHRAPFPTTGSLQGVQGSTQGINRNPMNGLTAPVGVQGLQPSPNREIPWSTRQKKVIDESLHMARSLGSEAVKAVAELMQADAMAQQAAAMLEIATQLSYIADYLGGKR